jgi:hypothetical protein
MITTSAWLIMIMSSSTTLTTRGPSCPGDRHYPAGPDPPRPRPQDPYRDKVRARIVLLALDRWPNAAIAREVGISVDTVRTWRGRFAEHGLAGLADRARSGRPARFTPVQVAQVKSLACRLPATVGAPLARWSCPEQRGQRCRHRDRPRDTDISPESCPPRNDVGFRRPTFDPNVIRIVHCLARYCQPAWNNSAGRATLKDDRDSIKNPLGREFTPPRLLWPEYSRHLGSE